MEDLSQSKQLLKTHSPLYDEFIINHSSLCCTGLTPVLQQIYQCRIYLTLLSAVLRFEHFLKDQGLTTLAARISPARWLTSAAHDLHPVSAFTATVGSRVKIMVLKL